jgi:hypothetical protein
VSPNFFFIFQPFFLKIFTFRLLKVFYFYFLDPELGAVAIGAEVTHFNAIVIGTEVQSYFLRDVDIAVCVTWTWHRPGAVAIGAELGATFRLATLATACRIWQDDGRTSGPIYSKLEEREHGCLASPAAQARLESERA